MPAQGHILNQDDMINVAAYLAEWNRTAKANGQGKTDPADVKQPIEY
jgi:hypothetical protein